MLCGHVLSTPTLALGHCVCNQVTREWNHFQLIGMGQEVKRTKLRAKTGCLTCKTLLLDTDIPEAFHSPHLYIVGLTQLVLSRS